MSQKHISLNTKIEPIHKGSKKLNVDKLPNMEPFSYSTKTLYSELISIMKQSTQEYYNMRNLLGFKCS